MSVNQFSGNYGCIISCRYTDEKVFVELKAISLELLNSPVLEEATSSPQALKSITVEKVNNNDFKFMRIPRRL